MGREIVLVFAYLIALLVLGWVNYWWFVGFVLLSPVISTVLAFKESEFWPAVHPQFGFFWTMPAIFIVYGLVLHHPGQWGQWLLCSALVSAFIVFVWTITLRRWIDREWTVFGTLGLVFVFVAFGLNIANGALPQERTSEIATILNSSPGGYRQPARIALSTRSREHEVFFPGLRRYFAIGPDDAACVRTYSGGLTWSWETIGPCTDEELERVLAD